MRIIWIGVAGSAGAISRYLLEGFITRRMNGAFPLGTLVVNLSGCFLLGLLIALFNRRTSSHPDLRAALTIGFVGAYTTFSTFAYETLRIGEDGASGLALVNTLVSVAIGVGAVWFGAAVGRSL